MNNENNNINNYNNNFYINNNDSIDFNSEIDSINFLGYPFNFIQNPENNEDINENQIYYLDNINNSTNSNDNSSSIISTPSPKYQFTTNLKKKRGREKNKNITDKKNFKIHDKLGEDNIIRKCQVAYINFIIKFMNILCSKFKINLSFISLDYKFKKIVNRKYRNILVSQTIEKIITNNISPKYKTKNKSINKEICEIIRQKGLIDFINILNKKFLFFFDKIYFTSNRKFNLKQFNLADIEIELPDDVKLYENLFDKNKNDINFKEYKEKMDETIKKKILPKINEYFFECH